MTACATNSNGVAKRPGRFRRLFVRPILWALAGLALVLFVGRLLIDSPWARARARAELETVLSRELGSPVTIDALEFELLPLTLQIFGLEIGGGPQFPNDPLVRVPWLEVEADFDALGRGKLWLRQLKLERPQIDLRFIRGADNLPSPPKGEGKGLFEVVIDRIEVERGRIDLFEETVDLSFAGQGLRARFEGLDPGRLAGLLSVEALVLNLPGASNPLELSLALRATVTAGGLSLEEAQLRGQGLLVEARGSCDWSGKDRSKDFCTFHNQGSAEGELLGILGYLKDLEGQIAFDGRLAWDAGKVGWRGQVASERLTLARFPFENFQGTLTADEAEIRINADQLGYRDGRIAGTILVDMRPRPDELELELELEKVRLDQLFEDLGIELRGLATRVGGQLSYRSPVAQALGGDGRAELRLSAADSSDVPAGLGLDGDLSLEVVHGRITALPTTLRSPQQEIGLSGDFHLAEETGDLRFLIATRQVNELVELLDLGPETPPWAPEAGSGRLDVALTLAPRTWRAAVELDLERLQTPRAAAARALGRFEASPGAIENLRLTFCGAAEDPFWRAPISPIGAAATIFDPRRVDHCAAFSRDGLAAQTLTISGRVPLAAAEKATLRFDAVAWPFADVAPWLDFKLPLAGAITGALELELEKDATRGSFDGRISEATVANVALDRLASRFTWDEAKVTFAALEAEAKAGTITGSGSLIDDRLDFAWLSQGLELEAEPINGLLRAQGLELEGRASVTGKIAGTLAQPTWKFEARASRLGRGEHNFFGDHRLDAVSEGGTLQLAGVFAGLGQIQGGGPFTAAALDLGLDLEVQNLESLLALLGMDAAGLEGQLQGRATVAGTPAEPRIGLALERTQLRWRGRELESRSPLVLARQGQSLRLEALDLFDRESRSSLTAQGQLAPKLDLEIEADLDLGWLAQLDSSFEARGRIDVRGRAGGALGEPTFEGNGRVRELGLDIPGFARGLEGANGDVAFVPGRIEIGAITGRFADGLVTGSGQIDLPIPGQPLAYRLQVNGRGLGIERQDGWSVRGDVDLTLRSAERGQMLAGQATLDRLDYRQDVRIDVAQLLRDFLRRRRLEVAPIGAESTTLLNVQVKAPGTVRVDNNLADLRGSADFTVRGTLAAPLIYGEIEIDKGGRLRYTGSDYIVERGRLVFADPFKIDPEVDLVAQTRVRDFDITLALFGQLDRLETRFSSQPPLPDVEVFRLLAAGELEDDVVRPSTGSEEKSLEAASFLYGQAATALGERFTNLFGFDKFRIDPLTGASGDNLSTARFTVGKRLSKDLFVTYSIDPSSTESQRLQVEWRLGEGLVLVLTQNGDNTYSADARWDTTF